jgi:hypothetical protein
MVDASTMRRLLPRRSFLDSLSMAAAVGLLPANAARLFSQSDSKPDENQELSQLLRKLLVTSDPELYAFAEKCVCHLCAGQD